MYIYEDHMGGLYTRSYQQDYDELYCEICCDSDWEIGCAETREDAKSFFCGEGRRYLYRYGAKYIREFINEEWSE